MPALDRDGDGFDLLISSLEELGGGELSLPAESVRLTLQGASEEGWPFERAWSSAINRVQASQQGGVMNLAERAQMLEDRTLLEEDRPLFQAAYEGREPSTRERAQRLAAAWSRTDDLRQRVQMPGRGKAAA